MQVLKIVAEDESYEPVRAHQFDAGADVRAASDATVYPGGRYLMGCGFKVDIPAGYVGLLFPRSGNAMQRGLTFANAVGVIDAGYHGEVACELLNLGDQPVFVAEGERIGQLVVIPVETPAFTRVPDESFFSDSARGHDGFGSTGAR